MLVASSRNQHCRAVVTKTLGGVLRDVQERVGGRAKVALECFICIVVTRGGPQAVERVKGVSAPRTLRRHRGTNQVSDPPRDDSLPASLTKQKFHSIVIAKICFRPYEVRRCWGAAKRWRDATY
jgi:hypothetical protein